MTKQPDVRREQTLAQTFVRLADTLVTGFDLAELFDDLVASCMDLFDLAAAGLVLADQRGVLHVMASSSPEARLVEVFELQGEQGPCLDAFTGGMVVASPDLEDQRRRWPTFAEHLASAGLGPAYAVPMRLRDQTIGAVNLFRNPGLPMSGDDLLTAQAMADVATIAILQHRASRASVLLAQQLQAALDSRVMIEQAKGVLAERGSLGMQEAFDALRAYSRSTNKGLTSVAEAIAHGELDPDLVLQRSSASAPDSPI